MPRAAGQKEYVSLAQGLITEASPLNFPENATSDELNCVLDKDGLIRRRRTGLANQFTVQTLASTGATLENVHYWQAPDLILFVVTETTPATKLLIHRNNSTLDKLGEITLNNAVSSTQIAVTTNYLAITTSEAQKPILLEYEPQNTRIRVYDIDLHVRDFELVDDGLGIAERPTVLSDNHEYNLYNAGWYKPRRDQYTRKQPFGDPVTIFFTDGEREDGPGNFPSNADIVSLGLSINENGSTTFRPDEVSNTDVGNSEAPRGHYVYNINSFDREARRVSKETDGAPNTTISLTGTVTL